VAGKADFDIWAADGKFTYGHCTATFVRCAVAGKHTWPGLTARYDNTGHTQRPHDTERRWQEARRLPHDETLPLPDRIAGLLVLLYAQNPADIEGLPTTAANDDWTIITLALASVPIVLPDPLAGLMREHLATRRGHATIRQPGTVPWLFPGGRRGHPLDAGHISERLKAIGLHPRADRAATLFTLAAELPAALLARMLGISIRTAVSRQKTASGDWMAYAAAVSRPAAEFRPLLVVTGDRITFSEGLTVTIDRSLGAAPGLARRLCSGPFTGSARRPQHDGGAHEPHPPTAR
jgi:hypothetical protein